MSSHIHQQLGIAPFIGREQQLGSEKPVCCRRFGSLFSTACACRMPPNSLMFELCFRHGKLTENSEAWRFLIRIAEEGIALVSQR
jgi:hypothetical protein